MRVPVLPRFRSLKGRGRGREAPPTRPGARRRLVGAGVVFAGLAVALWGQALGRREPPTPGRTPPFAPGPLQGEDEGAGGALIPPPSPGVILYVDDACRFCAEEVRRWTRATGGAAPGWLTVVRRPAEGVPQPGAVPTEWAHRTLLDRHGAIAAQLGVTAVPFLARTDATGTVVEVTLGLTSPERILTLLQTLGAEPGKGTHP